MGAAAHPVGALHATPLRLFQRRMPPPQPSPSGGGRNRRNEEENYDFHSLLPICYLIFNYKNIKKTYDTLAYSYQFNIFTKMQARPLELTRDAYNWHSLDRSANSVRLSIVVSCRAAARWSVAGSGNFSHIETQEKA